MALVLLGAVFIHATIFWVVIKKKVPFSSAVRLTCVAMALNRLFLSGSGYAAMSWKLKKENIPLHKSLSSFMVFEVFSTLPWLILGIYFGARVTAKSHILPISLILVFIALAFCFKKKQVLRFIRDATAYLKQVKFDFMVILPLVLLNLALGIIYYYFLLAAFGFVFSLTEVFKIATVSFTVGYLSPAPSGIGFKEAGIVYLLMRQNLALKSALSVAIADRVMVSVFYIVMGLLCGSKMIISELKRGSRLKRKKEVFI